MAEYAFLNKIREYKTGVLFRCIKEKKDIEQFDSCPAIIVVPYTKKIPSSL